MQAAKNKMFGADWRSAVPQKAEILKQKLFADFTIYHFTRRFC
jgi:hypothetical protein